MAAKAARLMKASKVLPTDAASCRGGSGAAREGVRCWHSLLTYQTIKLMMTAASNIT
jgi:hypothetical protein